MEGWEKDAPNVRKMNERFWTPMDSKVARRQSKGPQDPLETPLTTECGKLLTGWSLDKVKKAKEVKIKTKKKNKTSRKRTATAEDEDRDPKRAKPTAPDDNEALDVNDGLASDDDRAVAYAAVAASAAAGGEGSSQATAAAAPPSAMAATHPTAAAPAGESRGSPSFIPGQPGDPDLEGQGPVEPMEEDEVQSMDDQIKDMLKEQIEEKDAQVRDLYAKLAELQKTLEENQRVTRGFQVALERERKRAEEEARRAEAAEEKRRKMWSTTEGSRPEGHQPNRSALQRVSETYDVTTTQWMDRPSEDLKWASLVELEPAASKLKGFPSTVDALQAIFTRGGEVGTELPPEAGDTGGPGTNDAFEEWMCYANRLRYEARIISEDDEAAVRRRTLLAVSLKRPPWAGRGEPPNRADIQSGIFRDDAAMAETLKAMTEYCEIRVMWGNLTTRVRAFDAGWTGYTDEELDSAREPRDYLFDPLQLPVPCALRNVFRVWCADVRAVEAQQYGEKLTLRQMGLLNQRPLTSLAEAMKLATDMPWPFKWQVKEIGDIPVYAARFIMERYEEVMTIAGRRPTGRYLVRGQFCHPGDAVTGGTVFMNWGRMEPRTEGERATKGSVQVGDTASRRKMQYYQEEMSDADQVQIGAIGILDDGMEKVEGAAKECVRVIPGRSEASWETKELWADRQVLTAKAQARNAAKYGETASASAAASLVQARGGGVRSAAAGYGPGPPSPGPPLSAMARASLPHQSEATDFVALAEAGAAMVHNRARPPAALPATPPRGSPPCSPDPAGTPPSRPRCRRGSSPARSTAACAGRAPAPRPSR